MQCPAQESKYSVKNFTGLLRLVDLTYGCAESTVSITNALGDRVCFCWYWRIPTKGVGGYSIHRLKAWTYNVKNQFYTAKYRLLMTVKSRMGGNQFPTCSESGQRLTCTQTNMSESQLPPLSDDHVFSVSGTSLIDAPREEVWKVLLDFQTYGQWWAKIARNDTDDAYFAAGTRLCEALFFYSSWTYGSEKYIPARNSHSMTLTDKNKVILPDQTAVLGKHAQVVVNLTPKLGEPSAGLFSRGSAFVEIDTLDHENFCFSWGNADTMPSFLFRSKWWQTLSVDENTGKTKYYNVEFVGGLLAYFARFTLGSKLKVSFQAAADDLKRRVEE